MDSQRFTGKVAIVTGAGSGIGKGVVTRLVSEGAIGIVADWNLPAAEEVARQLVSQGGTALPYHVDLGDVAQIRVMVDKVIEQYARIDILVNNAAVNKHTNFFEMQPEEWDHVLGVNLRGVFFCAQAVGRHMKAQKSGRIINIASQQGKRPGRDTMHYSSSKAAVINLTRAIAHVLGSDNITVNAICPGYISTPLANKTVIAAAEKAGITFEQQVARMAESIPVHRGGVPEDIAGLVAYIASDESGYMTGEAINMGGGTVMD